MKADDINSNASIKERPLIYPSELAQLNRSGNMGNAVVTVFGYMPVMSKYTPSYACSVYTLEKTIQRLNVGRYFDESKVFYNMKRRNEVVIPKRPSRRPAGNGGMNIVRQMDGVKEYVKEQIERSFNSEIVSDEEKIELLNLIDKQAFLRAKSILEEAAKRATALNQDHLIDTFENLYKKLNWLQLNYSGGAVRNH